MSDQTVHLFGIRHHGPGCARSLLQALQDLQPDCLLVEGPPDGEEMLPFIIHADMQPPVALLVYAPEDSRRAAFYPFAEFSPEWQALRYGLQQQIAVRFMDLPITHQFALNKEHEEAVQEDLTESNDQETFFVDPLDWLGRAAGYTDGEAWWNHMVEERSDGLELFVAIGEAMTTLRKEAPIRERSEFESRRESLREAYMRKCLRQAQKEGFERIAVVCGAWHVPALENMPAAKVDNSLLKGLPKLKVAATWTPWTYTNLSCHSGYGAGVSSPAWYEHLWHSHNQRDRAIGWLVRAARLFRAEDIDCSSAHIIEAVRLAESLAAMRERPQPGLDELYEALQTVVCMGEEAPLQLIRRQLIVGNKLGGIPSEAPAVPLQRDIEQQQKTLRFKPVASQKTLDLDLRQPNDLARSHLLHRLRLLNIDWGNLTQAGSSNKGTFHELWNLQWVPELTVAIINASRWGNTVAEASTALAMDLALNTEKLSELSELINKALLADLQHAIGPIMHALEDKAATVGDAAQLLEALPSLAAIARYGNVRQTDVRMVAHVLDSLVPRAAIGLPGTCASLNEENSAAMRERIVAAHAAIALIGKDELTQDWHHALRLLALRDGGVHALLRGLAARLLFDAQGMSVEEATIQMSLALSAANAPAAAAAWIEGFLNQSAMVLLHDDALWALIDEWMSGLTEEHFVHVLPMMRRTFTVFSAPERRQLGERAKRPTDVVTTHPPQQVYWDAERAQWPIPLLRRVLGLPT